MNITIDDVKKLAKLSRLEFNEQETEQFVEELSATLAQVEAINRVDVSSVDLLEKTVNADTELRADIIKPSLDTSEIVANAPESQNGAFLVPITVAEE